MSRHRIRPSSVGAALVAAAMIAATILASAQPAAAVSDGDAGEGRRIIGQQIEAFRRDDGSAAFGFASPAIQGMFSGAETFLEMVRRSYAPVYRPRSFSFGAVRDLDDGFEQSVAIQDEAGADWDAVYTFERQPDGSWRIAGCRLVKRPGEAV